jgi:hypothetical protein
MKASLLSVALALARGAVAWKHVSDCDDIKYSSVPGFFLQDDPSTDPGSFDYVGVASICAALVRDSDSRFA